MSDPEPNELQSAVPADIRLVVFDFDGVFTDNAVWTDSDGRELVRSWRGDGLGLQKLRQAAIPAWVLSTEVNEIVARRCEKLGIPCRQGLPDKADALSQLSVELGIPLESTVYVGNDINDAGCLTLAGIPIVVADAHPDVLPRARYRTAAPGGLGAVREVCDWVVSGRTTPSL